MSQLKPYMAWSGDDPADGAVLAFARTSREARQIAFPVINGWFECDYINVRSRRLREHAEYLQTLATNDSPHVIDNPASCSVCFQWGSPIVNGMCESCADGYAEFCKNAEVQP